MITLEESRYARQELITWWDQAALRDSRVLVVGAGALGNEIVKNLTLLGVGYIEIVDMDTIERSNLARCVMFRDSDEGRLKAEALADAAHQLNPEVTTVAITDPVQAMGLGRVDSFDIIIAGLDNREARLWIAQAARKLGKPWIDGAIEGLRGIARVFLEEGPCYECTLGEVDRKIMSARKACSLLSVDEMEGGKVPTNSTSASVVAGIQVQEAVKFLVDRRDLLALQNEAWVFTGDTMDSYKTGYTEDEWCASHDRYEELKLWEPAAGQSLADLIDNEQLSALDAVEFEDDMVLSRKCSACGWSDENIRPIHTLGRGDGECPKCETQLSLEAGRSFLPTDSICQQPVHDLGIPESDVVTLRTGSQRNHYILRGIK
jgi:molybdopterin/thiamine biosynthesis adenylyltransferase